MIYVLDACAMIALLDDEPGADVVEMHMLEPGAITYAHAVNLCEVFYDALRDTTEAEAQRALADLRLLGVRTRTDMDDAFWQAVGWLKANYRVSLADCFALALTLHVGGRLLTSDHHEMDPLAVAGVCPITFFR